VSKKAKPRQSKAVAESDLEWAQRYCSERGFDWEFAQANGAVLLTEAESRREGFKPAGSGIYFCAVHPFTGEMQPGSRIRYRTPPVIEGRVRKFNARPRTESAVTFATASLEWKKLAADAKVPLVIAEGETRALAGATQSLPVIGLGGVFNGFVAGTHCGELLPVLRNVKWKGRTTYLAFDADTATNPKTKSAQEKLAALLSALDARVHVVQMPRLTSDGKTGLDDMLAHEGGAGCFRALCEAAPSWTDARAAGITPISRSLSDVVDEDVDYLWDGRIARGAVTMFSGDPGSAKTFVALSVAADLTRGRIPACGGKCSPLRIVYASTENCAETVTGPRFRAMDGDPRRFFLLDGATDAMGNPVGVTFADLSPVERMVESCKADVVFFDPIQSYFGADADFHKANEVRPRMDALLRMARERNIAIVLIRHLAKSSGGRAIHKGLGSIDFTGAVRIELMIGNAANAPTDRAIVPIKNNLGPASAALCFVIEGKGREAKVVWKGESVLTAADLVAPEQATGRNGIGRAVEFLRERLRDGPKLLQDLLSSGEFNKRMLERAANIAGVLKRRKKARGPVEWYLRGTKAGAE
jgi:hypothetical protein